MSPRHVVLGSVFLLAAAACAKPNARAEQVALTTADAGMGPASPVAPSASAPTAAASAAARDGACVLSPPRGVVVPSSAIATDVRLAASGGKALVTWSETTKSDDGPDRVVAVAHVFDATTQAVGPRVVVGTSAYGDEFLSGAAPVVVSGGLELVSCYYAAPAGKYGCTRGAPGQKDPPRLLDFGGISVGGPSKPDIAAVVRGEDTLVVVPDAAGKGVHRFSTRVSAKKKSYPFAMPEDHAQAADGLVAVDTSQGPHDGFAVVYRHRGAVMSRRLGLDEQWRAGAIELSAKGALVGVPVAAADQAEGGRFVVLFSQRKKASDPWRVRYVAVWPNGEVLPAELPTGATQAQGPGIAPAGPNCWLASWVEGTGKATRTRLARLCDRQGKPELAPGGATLSPDGVEGGRAYLATDPANAKETMAVWQEIPPGKPAELRVARVTCQ